MALWNTCRICRGYVGLGTEEYGILKQETQYGDIFGVYKTGFYICDECYDAIMEDPDILYSL